MASGSRMARARFCEDYMQESLALHYPQLSCPGCRLWHAIARIARAGETLFPNWDARQGLEEIRPLAKAKGRAH